MSDFSKDDKLEVVPSFLVNKEANLTNCSFDL